VAAATDLEWELRQLAGDDAAVRTAANEASAAGQIGQTLEDALVMQVAAGLLEAALGAVQGGVTTPCSTPDGGTMLRRR
jgi:hypothetical protein